MTQENLSERLNLYEAMFERNPRDGLVSVGKTYLYILSGRPQDALKSSLEASLSVSSKSLRVQLAIALGYYLRNKPSEALIESRYALNIDPASPLCHLVHASILLALKRTDEARLAFLKCLSFSSDNTFLTDLRLRNRRAICAAQLQNPLLAAYSNLRLRVPDMTETDVQQLVEQNPADPVLKALSASLQRRSGKIREALVLLESGLASYEAFPERLYLLWKTYDDQLGNHQKGEAFVRRLLEVDPLNDRATGLGYSNLDEETLRHINFIKSLEDLPDSIFAMVLPVRELENIVGTTELDTQDVTVRTPCEEKRVTLLERTFALPFASEQPQVPEPAAPPQVSPLAASPASEEPAIPSQPVMAHMASMLEQAQLIARDLRPTPAPAPLSHATVISSSMTPARAQPEPSSPVEPDVDTVLQVEEPAAEEFSPVPNAPPAAPIAIREQGAVDESPTEQGAPAQPPQPATPAQMTMRYANSLLADSRFEEALQAFLELSHTS